MRYLVTGCAGFIGSTLSDRLLSDGHEVVGVDMFTDYYDPALKRANLEGALDHELFELLELDLSREQLPERALSVDGVFHQAAQAGVRASWGQEFEAYTSWNVLGTQRLLEQLVRTHPDAPPRVVYASSSSIYGDAMARPTREDALPSPISPYGVTKLAGEHLCASYHKNFGLPSASLRYFTVYGERQRPDMAFHRFAKAAITGAAIVLYGDGEQSRDFTYIADAVQANVSAMASDAPFGVYNVGGGSTVTVNEVLQTIGDIVGRPLDVQRHDVQRGDVRHTSADTAAARETFGYAPKVRLEEGLRREVAWMEQMLRDGLLVPEGSQARA